MEKQKAERLTTFPLYLFKKPILFTDTSIVDHHRWTIDAVKQFIRFPVEHHKAANPMQVQKVYVANTSDTTGRLTAPIWVRQTDLPNDDRRKFSNTAYNDEWSVYYRAKRGSHFPPHHI